MSSYMRMQATSCGGYRGDDGHTVVLRPDGGGGALVGSGAAAVAPAALRHP